jgi:hypothetical protein
VEEWEERRIDNRVGYHRTECICASANIELLVISLLKGIVFLEEKRA